VEGSRKVRRTKTPYQRLLESADLALEVKEKLTARYKTLNPFDLKQGLQARLHDFKQYYQRQKLMLVG